MSQPERSGSDFPCPCISGVPPQRSLNGPPGDHPDGRTRDLPVLAHEGSVHAGFFDPAGSARGSRNAAGDVAFHSGETVSAPRSRLFRGSIAPPARTPRQRFGGALASAATWRGATAARYAFGVELFHLLLHAGLSRRISSCTQSDAPSCPLVSFCVLLVPRMRDTSVTRFARW